MILLTRNIYVPTKTKYHIENAIPFSLKKSLLFLTKILKMQSAKIWNIWCIKGKNSIELGVYTFASDYIRVSCRQSR